MCSKRTFSMAVAALTIGGSSIGVLRADTLYVNGETGNDAWDGRCEVWDGNTCGPKKTIQAGIDAATDSDEVVVARGVYTGDGNRDLEYAGKAVTVRSVDPFDPQVVSATVIDCEGTRKDRHRAFRFVSGEGRDAVAAGLTLTRGYSAFETPRDLPAPIGGAIYIADSSPTITHCVFEFNWATYGGGLGCVGGAPTISDCRFYRNSTFPDEMGKIWYTPVGGGIYARETAMRISDCNLEQNVASGYYAGAGGGIFCTGGDGVQIVASTVKRNSAGAQHGGGSGGGIKCNGTERLLISDCTISKNSAGGHDPGHGGGIALFNVRDPKVVRCTITGNSLYSAFEGSSGGGLYCGNSINVRVFDSEIAMNNGGAYGGGICMDNCESAVVSGCLIRENRVISSAWGGGICITASDASIHNSTFLANSAGGFDPRGGAIFCSNGVLSVSDSVLSRNRARSPDGGAGLGGAAYAHYQGVVLLSNCTMALNDARRGRAVACRDRDNDLAVVTIENSALRNGGDEVFGGEGKVNITYSNVHGGFPGEGNIDADPRFADPQNDDYHLLPDSPCIDAGDPAFIPQPGEMDMDNQMRLWDGDNDGLRRVDMGADEFASHVFGDLNCDGSLDLIDVEPFVLALIDESGYEQRYPDCEKLLGDANFDGSLDLTDVEPFIELLLR